VRKRDDDTVYGAPGIGDTYFENMHDVDTVTDTLLEGVRSLQQLPFSQNISEDFMDEQGNVSRLRFRLNAKSDPSPKNFECRSRLTITLANLSYVCFAIF
jgi:hypothetical protein